MRYHKSLKKKKIHGEFIENSPIIAIDISSDGELIIGRGKYGIVIDSGFTGDISMPKGFLQRLRVEYKGITPFQFADGRIEWKAVWKGYIILNNFAHEAAFIEGDYLLGMELASDIFSYFLIDFINEKVELKTK